MRLKILFHDNCFDGAASAAIFGAFYAERHPGAEVSYLGVQHKEGDPFPKDAWDTDEAACVDFRYSQHPKLTWWFDHHVSAFQAPEDRSHFEASAAGGQKFYDPKARSNTKFQSGVLAAKFGFDPARFTELVDWADVIDGAQFPDAATAVRLEAPALKLMTWIENNKDRAATLRYIADLQRRPLAEIAEDPYVTGPLAPVLAAHQKNIDAIRAAAREEGGVVEFDLVDAGVEAHNKFIAYWLFPACRYTVGLTRGTARVKISVGSNPWAQTPRTHDIAKICERYGGGGHPVVGAVSLPPAETDKARRIFREIVAELQR